MHSRVAQLSEALYVAGHGLIVNFLRTNVLHLV